MSEIISVLNARGHDVLILKLLGHNHDLDEMKSVTYHKWQQQMLDAFEVVTKKNKDSGKKNYFGGIFFRGCSCNGYVD